MDDNRNISKMQLGSYSVLKKLAVMNYRPIIEIFLSFFLFVGFYIYFFRVNMEVTAGIYRVPMESYLKTVGNKEIITVQNIVRDYRSNK